MTGCKSLAILFYSLSAFCSREFRSTPRAYPLSSSTFSMSSTVLRPQLFALINRSLVRHMTSPNVLHPILLSIFTDLCVKLKLSNGVSRVLFICSPSDIGCNEGIEATATRRSSNCCLREAFNTFNCLFSCSSFSHFS